MGGPEPSLHREYRLSDTCMCSLWIISCFKDQLKELETQNQELAKERGQLKEAKLRLEGQVSKFEVRTYVHVHEWIGVCVSQMLHCVVMEELTCR